MGKSTVNTNEHIKNKKYSKKEDDGSITTMLCLEANGLNKLHSIDEPALINKIQHKKEYYLNGIEYSYEIWNEIRKGREGLPWYKKPAPKGVTHRN
jgi:hypothetical protein|tara:strand:- start:116 stop:403 length:288 start_codon:yes stop_codon:yes gene_type:complete